MLNRSGRRFRMPFVVGTVAAAILASVVALNPAGAASPPSHPSHGALRHSLVSNKLAAKQLAAGGLPRVLQHGAAVLPAGVPKHGSYGFLLRLKAASTLSVYRNEAPRGRSVAVSAAKEQFARIKTLVSRVVDALPSGSRLLYTTHSALAGVAVLTDVHNYAALNSIGDVSAVYPIAPKSASNSYAMPLQGAPAAWQSHGGDLGQGTTIALIDTGIDYTHANFGGPGTTAAYQAARAHDTTAPIYPDPAKIAGGYDFAGDAYDASDPAHATPKPDKNPLDCSGHGSHVAGSAAGYGVTSSGGTYSGPYDATTDFNSLRIGPGMAPKAKILAYKVFGCGEEATTDLVGKAIEAAIDRNDDGVPSDHVDVINMSLGSDFGSPQDGDSVLANAASRAGITVVVASGNSGDTYDVGGSPGNATRAITVANSVDASNVVDSLDTSPGGPYGAERSSAYDWTTKPDLSGTLVAPSDSGNQDGCEKFSAADAAAISGNVAFLDWDSNDATRRCGSAVRADNVAAAGGTGFVFADDEDTFSAGILGDDKIPGVMVVKSASTALAAAMTAGPVTVTGTSASDFALPLRPQDNDELNDSSSRGERRAGDVKPDVSAVGTSVFSTAMGTGNEGISESGTSMATPMVAGLAALVRSTHPTWTPGKVKADIMNTAGEDVYAGANHTGHIYAPNRVGAGRIEADAALSNDVLAYVANDPGAVSVSFGPVAVTGRMTLSKTVDVVNLSTGPASFTVGYQPITSVPGVSYQVSPSSISVPAGATQPLTVKFVVTDPSKLTKTHDPTLATKLDVGLPDELPREFLADASGRLKLTPADSYTGPALRVPVYSAPRPASSTTERSTLTLPGRGVQFAKMRLSGHGINQGSGGTKVRSLMAGFELAAKSGTVPSCTKLAEEGCAHFPDERSADLKYVGFSSDAPFVTALGGRAIADGQAYFAITTRRPWASPVGTQEFDVLIDTNGDNKPDAVVYNTRLGTQDIYFSELLDITNPDNPCLRDDELLNDRFGDLDTALFDSDTMLLPLWPKALGAVRGAACANGKTVNLPALPEFSATHTRIHYGVESFGESGLVDTAGVTTRGHLTLSADVIHPGVEMVSSSSTQFATTGFIMNTDQSGAAVTVRRDVRAYNADHAQGALVIHFQNKVGAKAQLVTLKSKPKVSLSLTDSSIALGSSVTATVKVANTAGHTATGRVVLHRGNGSVLKRGRLSHGKVSFTWRPGSTGRFKVYAVYLGDAHYASGQSAKLTYRVT